jgi:ferritin
VPKKRRKLDPKNIQDKDLRTIVEQSNPKIWKVYVKMKEIARIRKSKKRRVRFKWRFQVEKQLLDKGQQVSNAINKMKEIARIRKRKKTKVKFKWQPQVGEQVLAKEQPVSNAVKRLYEGPLVIKEVVNVYLYKLQTKYGNSKGLFHISHLKPYVTPD